MNKAVVLLLLPLITLEQSKKKIETSFAPGPVFSSQLNTTMTTGLLMLTSFGYHWSKKWSLGGVADSKLLHTKKSNYSFRNKAESVANDNFTTAGSIIGFCSALLSSWN
jgi:hypothetical protein